MSELLRLAELCEKATGADRELDAEIFRAVYGAEVWSYNDNCHIDYQISRGYFTKPREEHPDFEASFDDIVTWNYRIGDGPDAKHGDLPALTASIDAAMTLVPEGHGFYLRRNISSDGDVIYCNAQVWPFSDPSDDEAPRSWSNSDEKHPALALCAASLRASDTAGVR
jgi:hypothetical protein